MKGESVSGQTLFRSATLEQDKIYSTVGTFCMPVLRQRNTIYTTNVKRQARGSKRNRSNAVPCLVVLTVRYNNRILCAMIRKIHTYVCYLIVIKISRCTDNVLYDNIMTVIEMLFPICATIYSILRN
jgi:hypothetical protein